MMRFTGKGTREARFQALLHAEGSFSAETRKAPRRTDQIMLPPYRPGFLAVCLNSGTGSHWRLIRRGSGPGAGADMRSVRLVAGEPQCELGGDDNHKGDGEER